MLGLAPSNTGGAKLPSGHSDKFLEQAENFLDLPQSVLQIVAISLQCDILVAGLFSNSTGQAETVVCVPKGKITVPVRLSHQLIAAAASCEVINTEGVLLPTVITAVLGIRPKRFLATCFNAEGHEGLCYAVWVDPAKVPDVAADVMTEAGRSLPLLLANRVRAVCCDRMGRRFDSVMKRSPQAVVFVDDGSAPCLINSSAAKLLGLPNAGEMDPRQVAGGMRRLADRNETRANAYRCFSTLVGKPHQAHEWVWELKEPRSVLRVRSYPVSNVATHGRVWLFDDVTKERDAKDAVEAADMAKSQFLAMMSHELRTPMTGVLGMLDLLRLTSLTPEQAGFVRVMQGSAEGLMQVLNEILDFSKIQSGHLALDIVDFHIGELLEQVSALFQGRLAEKKLPLRMSKPPTAEMAVRGDANRLRQVLTNLLSNAIKFTEHGSICITWKKTHRCNVFSQFPDDVDMVQARPVKGQEVGINGSTGQTSVPGDLLQIDKDKHENSHNNGMTSAHAERLRLVLAECPFSYAEDDAALGTLDGEGERDYSADKSYENGNTSPFRDECEVSSDSDLDTRMWFEVRVSDTGIGLTQEQQSRLFQCFSQADSSTTRKFGGTGLGLAISKGLVVAMGGNITVDSEIGKGSTFIFWVPLQPSVSDPEYLPEPDPPFPQQAYPFREKERSLQVLVAEDNKVNQLLISKMLRHYGHEVELVGNGQLAVEALQTRNHDMILMDLQMPVLDGLSATKAIRALGGCAADVPIYALTADVLTKGQESLESMGLDGYLTKPINWQSLSQVIEKVVRGRRRYL